MAKRGKYQCLFCGRQTYKNQKEYKAHLSDHIKRGDTKVRHGKYEERKPRVDRRGKFL